MEEEDIFRALPLRYLGYANEVGEAFRHIVPVKLVYFSYFISSAYVAAHSLFRGSVARKQVELNRNHTMHDKEGIISLHKKSPEKRLFSPTEAVVDTLIWQGLASVIIPGLVINRTCALTRLLLYQLFRNKLSKTVRKWTVTGIGLGCIPFIIHPIDRTVDNFMNFYMRPLMPPSH